jgi:hypothetical protein
MEERCDADGGTDSACMETILAISEDESQEEE